MSESPNPLASVATNFSGELGDQVWVEVITKMEEVYSDLIRHEVELEEKNKALNEAHGFINNVLASMQEILIVCDRRMRVREVNRACLDLMGRQEADLLGKPFVDLVHAADQPLLQRQARTFGAGADAYAEIRLKDQDGLPTDPVSFNRSSLIDDQRREAGTVFIGRPMGELRRAYRDLNLAHAELQKTQQQLVRSEKMASLGRLVAGVAHELNNPISFINGNVHVLESYRQRLTAYLDAIHTGADTGVIQRLRQELRIDSVLSDLAPLLSGTQEGAQRVSDIVKSLRRMSFGGRNETTEFDLSEVVRRAVNWAIKGKNAHVALTEEIEPGLLVRGSEGQIHQVIVNLMDNALDAVAACADPRVEVVAALEEGRVRVGVGDNGHGLSDIDLMRVFDPFFTTKQVGQGTGLGLWISEGIARDHQGEIQAAHADGGGARFTLILPPATPR